MLFDLLTPPQGHRGKTFGVARPIHVSNSHTKFGWILSNGLVDNITDGRTDGRIDGRRRLQYPLRFFKNNLRDNKKQVGMTRSPLYMT